MDVIPPKKQAQLQSASRKKQATVEDLKNRNKSRLSCKIRKKYTKLMKETIQNQKSTEKVHCCGSCRLLTGKMLFKIFSSTFQAIISILAVCLYVAETYMPDSSSEEDLKSHDMTLEHFNTLEDFYSNMEIIIASIVLVDLIYNFIIAKSKLKFILNILNILDMVIILSIYLPLCFDNSNVFTNLGFARIFRVVRIVRIFRIFKFLRSPKSKNNQDENQSEITRRLATAVMTILSLLFLSTGIVHYLHDTFPDIFHLKHLNTGVHCSNGTHIDNNFTELYLNVTKSSVKSSWECPPGEFLEFTYDKLDFDHIFYYMVITMTTVGYGDIYPGTVYMRVVIGFFVIVSIINISKQTSEINDILKINSEYRSAYESNQDTSHIVLTGFFSKNSLMKFLMEFYHNDHQEDSNNIKIVIIQPEYPEKDIQSVLMNPRFEESLHFIVGDIFVDKTLSLAAIDTAKSIFLLSDQNSKDALKNDLYLILACKAISQNTNISDSQIFSQFNYSHSLLHDWADWDIACSSQQIKMSIIVKNGFVYGFSTMIMNLISSSGSVFNSEIQDTPWMLEYMHGASQEIYIIPIEENIVGENYINFVRRAYTSTGVLVIGVKKKMKYIHDETIFYFQYLINPIDYKLGLDDELIMIALDSGMAKSIFDVKQPEGKIQTKYKFYSDLDKNLFYSKFKVENMMKEKTVHEEESFEEVKRRKGDDDESINSFEESSSSSSNNSDEVNTKLKMMHNKKLKGSIFEKKKHFKIWENNPDDLTKSFENHYLIFCKEEHLLEFMQILDNYHSEIVFFVSDQHPSTKWDVIRRYYDNLIYIECSYSDQEDLKKLRLEDSRHVYILTWAVENTNVSDSGILPLVKIIEESFPGCNYTLELSDELNVRYLNNKGFSKNDLDNSDADLSVIDDEEGRDHSDNLDSIKEDEKMDLKEETNFDKIPYRIWPKYAKSDIFFSSSLDSLLAISFYNDGLLDVLLKIIGTGEDLVKPKDPLEVKDSNAKKAPDTPLYKKFRTFNRSKSINDNNVDKETPPTKENNIITMLKYNGDEKIYYGKVFEAFLDLEEPLISLGIYRETLEKTDLKNNCPYVITNPKSEVFVYKGDFIIVIGIAPKQFVSEEMIDQKGIDDFMDDDLIASGRKFGVMAKNSPSKSFMTKYIGKKPIEEMNEEQIIKGILSQMEILKSMSEGTYTAFSSNNVNQNDHINIQENSEGEEDAISNNSVKPKKKKSSFNPKKKYSNLSPHSSPKQSQVRVKSRFSEILKRDSGDVLVIYKSPKIKHVQEDLHNGIIENGDMNQGQDDLDYINEDSSHEDHFQSIRSEHNTNQSNIHNGEFRIINLDNHLTEEEEKKQNEIDNENGNGLNILNTVNTIKTINTMNSMSEN